jgi:hypothetical protein
VRLRFVSPRHGRARPVVVPIEGFRGPVHGWWREFSRVGPRAQKRELDLCDDCGHIRALHAGDCFSPSTKLIGEPDPCRCVNSAESDRYRRPGAK